LLEGTRFYSGNGSNFQAIHDTFEVGEVVGENAQYVAEGTEYSRMQNVIDIGHDRGIRSSNRERLGFVAGCVRDWYNRRRRITFGKEHRMVEVEACVIDSQSDNAFITLFIDVIWKKLSKS
jgi:hypothetical protein